MYRYPDGTIKRRLPNKITDGDVVRWSKDMTVEQLDALGYNEAIPIQRQPFTTYTTEWVKDGLVYREQIVTAVVDEEARDAALAESVRAERDRLLAECDWTQLADVPLDALEIGLWADYRQALRDVPGQAGFPGAVEWPVRPGE
ncbi:tail fiber assembly protein [Pseudodesulfovibrio pelocollis]|uniref:tail fiber assembly protein n=1 Tax=Pseudodesulfovibrio pelocollis TaxID=3051432 RepID=UPI00255AFEEB|nr:tail fiber assembly protein [Pseudodesulfovibrio sp. SB368]